MDGESNMRIIPWNPLGLELIWTLDISLLSL
jgi:hypothetical protein